MNRFFKFKESSIFYNPETKDKLFSVYAKFSSGLFNISDDGKNFYITSLNDLIVVDVEDCKDEVNHPEHYTSGKYETIDIIKDSVDDFKSYVHGNIIEYILRYKRKGGVQDLKKAQIYLSWLIKEEECKHL